MNPNADIQIINLEERKRFSPDGRVNQGILFSSKLETRMNCYEPGQITPMHCHPDEDEILIIVEGHGRFTFKEREDLPVTAGDVICLPAGLEHRIEAAPDSRMVLMYVIPKDYRTVSSEELPQGGKLPGEIDRPT